MTIDWESMQFSTAPIEGMDEAAEQWKEAAEFTLPPQPGVQLALITAVMEMGENKYEDDNHIEHLALQGAINLKIAGGDDDGVPITWQRISSKFYTRFTDKLLTSGFLDLAKSANVTPIPKNNQDFALMLKHLIDNKVHVRIRYNWSALCGKCYEAELMILTGQGDGKLARQLANSDQKKAAAKVARFARNERAFQQDENGKYIPFVKCLVHGDQVMAQVSNLTFIGGNSASDVPF